MNFTDYQKLDAEFRKAMNAYSKVYHFGGVEGDEEGGYILANKYLDAMKEKAQQDDDFCEKACIYFKGTSEAKTIWLKKLLWEVETYDNDKQLNQHNGLAYIDSVSYHFNRESRTLDNFSIDGEKQKYNYYAEQFNTLDPTQRLRIQIIDDNNQTKWLDLNSDCIEALETFLKTYKLLLQ